MMTSGDDSQSNGRLRPRKLSVGAPQRVTRNSDTKTADEKQTKVNLQSTSVDKPLDNPINKLLCPYCEKCFTIKPSLLKHVTRVHSSAASVKCQFCDHSDSNLDEAARHMSENHPNDYFICLDCRTRFQTAQDLTDHQRTCIKQGSQSGKPYKNKLRAKAKTVRDKQIAEQKNESTTPCNVNAEKPVFNGIVISCELKPPLQQETADIEDNITTNLILPNNKNIDRAALQKNAVIVIDEIQWSKRIPSNFCFHNSDADQILSRLGVVHRSPRVGESTRRDWYKHIEDSTKFEKCFDTSFYTKVASNVHENLTKYLDGSFIRFNQEPENVIKTRKSKNNVAINTVEGFPTMLASSQYSRSVFDSYLPRSIAPRHKWKWEHLDLERNPINQDQIKRYSHVANCIITLVSSLDIWTQSCMRDKYEAKFNNTSYRAKNMAKQNVICNELKEILESREIPKPSSAIVKRIEQPLLSDEDCEFARCLGLVPREPTVELPPAVLSGECVRPRCFICCACGEHIDDYKTLRLHKSAQHPYAQVAHYEIVGDVLLKADIMKHLYVPPPQPSGSRSRPPRGIKECTKCNTSIVLEDLHQHMLDCAGDAPVVKRRGRTKIFGSRKRRPRMPDNTLRKQMRKGIRHRQNTQKNMLRRRLKVRTEVGDAETIRKMLADLPAKRHRVTINPVDSSGSRTRREHDRARTTLLLRKRAAEAHKAKPMRMLEQNNAHTNPRPLRSVTTKEINTPCAKKDKNIITAKMRRTLIRKAKNQQANLKRNMPTLRSASVRKLRSAMFNTGLTKDVSIDSTNKNDLTSTSAGNSSARVHGAHGSSNGSARGHGGLESSSTNAREHAGFENSNSNGRQYASLDSSNSSSRNHAGLDGSNSQAREHANLESSNGNARKHGGRGRSNSNARDHAGLDNSNGSSREHAARGRSNSTAREHAGIDRSNRSAREHAGIDRSNRSAREHADIDRSNRSAREHADIDRSNRSAREHAGFGSTNGSAREHAGLGSSNYTAREHAGFGSSNYTAREHAGFGSSNYTVREHAGFGSSNYTAREHAGFGGSKNNAREHAGFGSSNNNASEHAGFGGSKNNAREHAGYGGSNNNARENAGSGNSNSRQQRTPDTNEQGGRGAQNPPHQEVPLKHSIARLTANDFTHDKAVQFQPHFLVHQECYKNIDRTFMTVGQPVLFEYDSGESKLDKPPLDSYYPDYPTDNSFFQKNHAANKNNKPRKGLNDCIAMLKNKLVDPITPDEVCAGTQSRSVLCDTADMPQYQENTPSTSKEPNNPTRDHYQTMLPSIPPIPPAHANTNVVSIMSAPLDLSGKGSACFSANTDGCYDTLDLSYKRPPIKSISPNDMSNYQSNDDEDLVVDLRVLPVNEPSVTLDLTKKTEVADNPADVDISRVTYHSQELSATESLMPVPYGPLKLQNYEPEPILPHDPRDAPILNISTTIGGFSPGTATTNMLSLITTFTTVSMNTSPMCKLVSSSTNHDSRKITQTSLNPVDTACKEMKMITNFGRPIPSTASQETQIQKNKESVKSCDTDTAKKIAMLPQPIVEILGTMPVASRNQLLNVLPQYMTHTCVDNKPNLPVETAWDTNNIPGYLPRTEIATQTAVALHSDQPDKSVPEICATTSNTDIIHNTTSVSRNCDIQIESSIYNNGKSLSNANVAPTHDFLTRPHTTTPHKTGSEKTASLRAVRIKTADRLKTSQQPAPLNKNLGNQPGQIETQSDIITPLAAVQQAEVSSSHTKIPITKENLSECTPLPKIDKENDIQNETVSKSLESSPKSDEVRNESDENLELGEKQVNTNSKCTLDAPQTVHNQSERNEISSNLENNLNPCELKAKPGNDIVVDQSKTKYEDDSEDDISLALIVKQKNHNDVVSKPRNKKSKQKSNSDRKDTKPKTSQLKNKESLSNTDIQKVPLAEDMSKINSETTKPCNTASQVGKPKRKSKGRNANRKVIECDENSKSNAIQKQNKEKTAENWDLVQETTKNEKSEQETNLKEELTNNTIDTNKKSNETSSDQSNIDIPKHSLITQVSSNQNYVPKSKRRSLSLIKNKSKQQLKELDQNVEIGLEIQSENDNNIYSTNMSTHESPKTNTELKSLTPVPPEIINLPENVDVTALDQKRKKVVCMKEDNDKSPLDIQTKDDITLIQADDQTSIPLRRSRRGKSLYTEVLPETKPVEAITPKATTPYAYTTKKQLIFTKMLLDEENLRNEKTNKASTNSKLSEEEKFVSPVQDSQIEEESPKRKSVPPKSVARKKQKMIKELDSSTSDLDITAKEIDTPMTNKEIENILIDELLASTEKRNDTKSTDANNKPESEEQNKDLKEPATKYSCKYTYLTDVINNQPEIHQNTEKQKDCSSIEKNTTEKETTTPLLPKTDTYNEIMSPEPTSPKNKRDRIKSTCYSATANLSPSRRTRSKCLPNTGLEYYDPYDIDLENKLLDDVDPVNKKVANWLNDSEQCAIQFKAAAKKRKSTKKIRSLSRTSTVTSASLARTCTVTSGSLARTSTVTSPVIRKVANWLNDSEQCAIQSKAAAKKPNSTKKIRSLSRTSTVTSASLAGTCTVTSGSLARTSTVTSGSLARTSTVSSGSLARTCTVTSASLARTCTVTSASLARTCTVTSASLSRTCTVTSASLSRTCTVTSASLARTYTVTSASLSRTCTVTSASLARTCTVTSASLARTCTVTSGSLARTSTVTSGSLARAKKIGNNEQNDSDDSMKSDVPLTKYVSGNTKTTAITPTDQDHSKEIDVIEGSSKSIYDNPIPGGSREDQQEVNTGSKKKCRGKKRKSSEEDHANETNSNEDTERLRSEQFMESFGFFSERKPRKSNLLATKKISETFHNVDDSDDFYSGTKERTVRKSRRKSSLRDDTKAKEPKPSTSTVARRSPRKKDIKIPHECTCPKERVVLRQTYCKLCDKQFRRLDNFYRHLVSPFHVTRLAKDMNIDVEVLEDGPNFLEIYKEHLIRLIIRADKIDKKNKEMILKSPNAPLMALPTIAEIMADARLQTFGPPKPARRGLSNDEALFLDCCELLHKTEVPPGQEHQILIEVSDNPRPDTPIPKGIEVIAAEKSDPKSDGDVDSITAKNIMESEEVRNLEKDLFIHIMTASSSNVIEAIDKSNLETRESEIEQQQTTVTDGVHTEAEARALCAQFDAENDESYRKFIKAKYESEKQRKIISLQRMEERRKEKAAKMRQLRQSRLANSETDSLGLKHLGKISKDETDITENRTETEPGTSDSIKITNPTFDIECASKETQTKSLKNKSDDSKSNKQKASVSMNAGESSNKKAKTSPKKPRKKRHSETGKPLRYIDSKDEHYKEINVSKDEPVHIFEDKFDKIKRKSVESEADVHKTNCNTNIATAKKSQKKPVKTKRSRSMVDSSTREDSESDTKEEPFHKINIFEDELVDMFEDKFDKIKRKCRSQVAAVKTTPSVVESSKTRHKGKAKALKKKGQGIERKAIQNTIMTKGALKGYEGIKVSIPTTDIDMSAITPSVSGHVQKKSKRHPGKKRRVKKYNSGDRDRSSTKYSRRRLDTSEFTDIYEFNDDDTDMFEFRPSTIKERFKSTFKDAPSTSIAGQDVKHHDESSSSGTDGDDFVYMSDDYLCSAEDTENSEHSSAKFGGEPKKARKKESIEKHTVMGKIFKNNAVRTDKKTLGKTNDKQKTNFDQLFDSLLEDKPNSFVGKSDMKDNVLSARNLSIDEDYLIGFKDIKSTGETSSQSPNTEIDSLSLPLRRKRSTDNEKETKKRLDEIDRHFSSDTSAGVARHRTRRKCAVGKQNVLAETWSSESESERSRNSNSGESVVASGSNKKRRLKRGPSLQAGGKRGRYTKKGRNPRMERPALLAGSPANDHEPPVDVYEWSANDDHPDTGHKHTQQHGWIVGDSHKKLVTMIVTAKGKNRDDKPGQIFE